MIETDQFENIIISGDIPRLEAFVNELSPKEKSKIATAAFDLLKNAMDDWRQEPPRWEQATRTKVIETSALAAMLTATEKQLEQAQWGGWFTLPDDAYHLLQRLKPQTLRNFGDILLEKSVFQWIFVRTLLQFGIIDKPQSEQYLLGLFGAPRYVKTRDGERLRDYLLKHEDLHEDVWRLFEIEGDQENSFASADKYNFHENSWETALLQLSNERVFSRERLLLESLKSLDRGFIQFRAGWFSRFHEALKPTLNERELHAEAYAKLLSSSVPPTVSFAIKALSVLDASNRLPEEILAKYIAPALSAPAKATASSALKMIERAIARNAKFASQGCLRAAEALNHPVSDIQGQAIKLLTKHSSQIDPALAERIYQTALNARGSLKEDFAQLLNMCAPSKLRDTYKSQSKVVTSYVMQTEFCPDWPFGTVNTVRTIEDIEELILRASFCLEHPEDPIEFERVLDAVSRLSLTRPADFASKTGALKKRSKKLAEGGSWTTPISQTRMARFIFDWLEGENKTLIWNQENGIGEFPTRRLQNVLKRVLRSESLPLLSTPTCVTGWIDPHILQQRESEWKKRGIKCDEFDLAQALLRVPGNSIKPFLQTAKPSGELWDALAFSTQSHNPIVAKVQELRSVLWRAATWVQQSNADPSKSLFFNSADLLKHEPTAATSYPVLRESLFAITIREAAIGIDYAQTSDRLMRPAFEVLTESGAPLGRKAIVLIAIGLTILDPELAGFSRDAIIIAIEERRLDLAALAVETSKFLHSGRNKPKRLAAALTDISRVSDLHLNAMRRLIELTLHGDGSRTPKDLSAVLEVLNELLIAEDSKIEDAETIAYLKSVTMGGKTSKLIKTLSERFQK